MLNDLNLVLRLALGAVGAVGVLLLFLTLPATIVAIDVLTTNDLAADVDTRLTGADRHALALVLLGLLGAVMVAGAVLRSARPAMVAVAACGAVALFIAAGVDGPDLDDTGEVGQLYENASAKAGSGFYLETAGGVLLLVSGVGMLVLSAAGPVSRSGARRPRVRSRADAEDDPDAEPAPRRGE